MKRLLRCAVVLGAILMAAPLPGQDRFEGREAASQRVLVKFRPGLEWRSAEAAAEHDIDLVREVGRDGVLLMHSRSRDVTRLVQELKQRPYVQYVEPDYVVRATATPNDPSFPVLWGLQNTGQLILGVPGTPGADIGAVPAWDVSTGSSSVVVGVVDTGVDYGHQDLQANVWSAPSPFTVMIGGVPVNCPAGSHGYNAITRSCDPMDDNNHGTHVSGTIGARGNNALGVTGVNWTTSIMGLKFLDSTGNGSTSDAIDAIEFAIQTKAIFGAAANVRVLSNSWGGGGFSQALLDEINKAAAANMLFVASAGNSSNNNDTNPNYPASFNAANEVSVAAIDNLDQLASFSNFGATSVSLGAPGVSIASTIRNNSYAYFNGTSMAAPHVSGAAALVLSACDLSTASLKQVLLANVVQTSALRLKTSSGGRLNVNQAIRACSSSVADFSLSATPPSQTVAPGNATSYSVNINPTGGFAAAITFTVSGLPSGALGVFSPNPSSGASSTLTVWTNASAPVGTYPLIITGAGGGLSHSTLATLTIGSGPDFSLSAAPPSQTVTPGNGTTYTVNIVPPGGFAGPVAFTVSGLPLGASGTFSPNPSSGAPSTLTITTNSTTPAGTYPLTITGTSGSLSRSTSVTLIVASAADFSLSATPPSQTVTPGGGTTYTVNIARTGGFAGVIALSVGGLPSGAGGTFSPNPSSGASSALTITTSSTTPAGSYPLTITGASGSLTHSTSATLIIAGAVDFSLSVTPPSQTVSPGSSTTYTVNIIPTGGFAAAIAFAVSGLPSGALGVFSPNPSSGASSTLTIWTNITVPAGTYPLTITGTSGSLSHATTATLILGGGGGADFSLSATPPSQTVNPGNGTTYTVNITPSGGFAGAVAFTVSGLPPGAGGTYSPNPSSGASSTLTITTSSTTPAGSYPLTITGASGSLSHSTSATLIVASADFSLSATPPSQTVNPGNGTSYTVNIARTGGFAGAVAFTVSGLPVGAGGTFNPNPSSGSSAPLTITTSSTTPAGSYPLTITGASGSLSHSTSATLIVAGAVDFSLSVTPPTRTVAPGNSTSYTVNITPIGGFAGAISFSVSGLPFGALGIFSPSGTSSTLTIWTSSSAASGSYPLTITGASGSLSHTAPATLVVN